MRSFGSFYYGGKGVFLILQYKRPQGEEVFFSMNKYVTWADLDFSKPNSNDTISDVKKNVQKSKSLNCFDS